jgi:hypothetical protein
MGRRYRVRPHRWCALVGFGGAVAPRPICNLYSITKGPRAIRDFARAMRDKTGNLPPIPGVFPDNSASIIRNAPAICGHRSTVAIGSTGFGCGQRWVGPDVT